MESTILCNVHHTERELKKTSETMHIKLGRFPNPYISRRLNLCGFWACLRWLFSRKLCKSVMIRSADAQCFAISFAMTTFPTSAAFVRTINAGPSSVLASRYPTLKSWLLITCAIHLATNCDHLAWFHCRKQKPLKTKDLACFPPLKAKATPRMLLQS